jgi:hypothetical protein
MTRKTEVGLNRQPMLPQVRNQRDFEPYHEHRPTEQTRLFPTPDRQRIQHSVSEGNMSEDLLDDATFRLEEQIRDV